MNFLEPSSTGSGRFDRPPENIDGLLRAFFQAEVPSPWPEMTAPVSAAAATAPAKPRVRSLVRSRLALAASIALLAIGPWLVAGKFQTVRKTDPGPGVGDVGSKPSAPSTPEKIRR